LHPACEVKFPSGLSALIRQKAIDTWRIGRSVEIADPEKLLEGQPPGFESLFPPLKDLQKARPKTL